MQIALQSSGGNMWTISCLLVIALGLVQGRIRLDPLVDTQQGLIRGLRAENGDYSMFLGIPYAKVDEKNPFGASSPHPKFDQVFEAFDDSAVCPQVEEFNNSVVGSLDCLNLNVFVPNIASSKNKLPVLVWIHGGGFVNGFGNRYLFGPKFLVRHNVIIVSINYRLGPYGFLCLDTPEVPGNQGLKDQRLALRWIKNNIVAFGGDDKKITIMGESAGSASVDVHLIYQQETLFSQAILQSGNALSPWAVREADASKPLKLAEHLGFKTEDLSEALDFLKTTDVKLVIGATSELDIPFQVCIEKEFENVESIILEHPQNVEYTKVKRIPILSGFNNREYLFIYGAKNGDFFKNLNVFSDLKLSFNYDEEFQEMEDLVRHFYIGEEEINEELHSQLIDFNSDYQFNYPAQKSMHKYLENGAEAVYHYLFSYNGGRNFVKNKLNISHEAGASHADEIGYLFDLEFDKALPSEADQRMIDQITTLWTNFVKYGNPTPEVTDLLPVKWLPISKDNLNYLEIDAELAVKKRPFHDRLAFWELFYKANKDKVKGRNIH